MKVKFFYFFIISVVLIVTGSQSMAQKQNDSVLQKKPDTNHALVNKKPVAARRPLRDTVNEGKKRISILNDTPFSNALVASKPIQAADSLNDSLRNNPDSLADSLETFSRPVISIDSVILAKNPYINSKGRAISLEEQIHIVQGKEFLFYFLCLVVLILGLFRTFFTGYFKNLFRVYFNTSLRQTQLSDQLQQATLPSLILNIFFTITAGIYIWLLFNFSHPPKMFSGRVLLPFCILSIGVIYFLKFCMLKFMGWVSDVTESTNGYIFAIFLVNKITGIFLVPVVIMIAFINQEWLPTVINISFMLIGLLFLSRYVKSYGIIEKKIPLNPFHFVIYIAGAEIIPLFILYKVAIDYLI
ncbi:MAG: DUF4271 domain-containing protein [Ginsengibacter sp.]